MRPGPTASLLLGVALLAASAFLASWDAGDAASMSAGAPGEAAGPSGRATATPRDEAWARALRPLGPVRPLLASILWVTVLDRSMEGDSAAVADVAEALLALHPDLHAVRTHLATVLVVNEAPRAPDDDRHRALVERGLLMLEEGLAAAGDDDVHLHGALGRLLAVQVRSDPRFPQVARSYFGEQPEDIAIQELRRGDQASEDALWLIELLVDRGRNHLRFGGDPFEAARDLAEAEEVLRALPEDARRVYGVETEALREELEAHSPPRETGRP